MQFAALLAHRFHAGHGAALEIAHDRLPGIGRPVSQPQGQRAVIDAIAAGVFGVPTLSIDGELFWGNESHALMAAVLADPALLQRPEWQRIDALPVAVERSRPS